MLARARNNNPVELRGNGLTSCSWPAGTISQRRPQGFKSMTINITTLKLLIFAIVLATTGRAPAADSQNNAPKFKWVYDLGIVPGDSWQCNQAVADGAGGIAIVLWQIAYYEPGTPFASGPYINKSAVIWLDANGKPRLRREFGPICIDREASIAAQAPRGLYGVVAIKCVTQSALVLETPSTLGEPRQMLVISSSGAESRVFDPTADIMPLSLSLDVWSDNRGFFVLKADYPNGTHQSIARVNF